MTKIKKYLITGAAGFIGSHLAKYLLERGFQVVGFDNVNDSYSVQLKRDRLALIRGHENFRFLEADLRDRVSARRDFIFGLRQQ